MIELKKGVACMELKTLGDLVANYGMAFMVTIYFLYKDYCFNNQILETLTAVKDVLSALENTVYRSHSEEH